MSNPSLLRVILATLVLSVVAGPAFAAVVDLELVADGDGRWSDLFSDAFGQVDGGPAYPGSPGFDGFYQVSALPSFVTIGGGATVFPLGADFGDAGDVTVDVSGITGVGVELAPITDVAIDFTAFIANDDAVTGGGYTTSFSGVSGNVTYTDGVPTSIDLTSTVTFSYDFSAFGAGVLDFVGTFGITSNSFTLFVDSPQYPSQFGTVAFIWDVTGVATPVGGTPSVPVAGVSGVVLLACSLGAAGYAAARRRRGRV